MTNAHFATAFFEAWETGKPDVACPVEVNGPSGIKFNRMKMARNSVQVPHQLGWA